MAEVNYKNIDSENPEIGYNNLLAKDGQGLEGNANTDNTNNLDLSNGITSINSDEIIAPASINADRIKNLSTGSPGGDDTQIQFNDGGIFGGDANLTWNKTSKILSTFELNTALIQSPTFGQQLTINSAGVIRLDAGDGNSGNSGYDFEVDAGDATSNDKNGGNIDFYPGDGIGAGAGGDFTIHGGPGGTDGNGGSLTISSGNGGSSGGDAGLLLLVAGSAGGGDGGKVSIYSGGGINGGAIEIVAEEASRDDSGLGGSVLIASGEGGTDGDGGVINIRTGTGRGTGDGGHLNLTASEGGATGDGGNVNINSGNCGGDTSGNGGTITINPGQGVGVGNSSGDVRLTCRNPNDSNARQGKIIITDDTVFSEIFVNRISTTDATPTAKNLFNMSGNIGVIVEAKVIARKTGGTYAAYIRRALFKTVSGTTTLLGSIQDVFTVEEDASWDCTFVISTNDIQLQVTGAASSAISWSYEIRLLNTATTIL